MRVLTAAHSMPGRASFCASRLEGVFARCFEARYRTSLRGGYPEPLYRPAVDDGAVGCIAYRGDFFASALHEVAHWCIAGAERRTRVDYGYWYAPDGRDAQAQQAFEAAEFKPQALEWIFARACGYPFHISLDNLESGDCEPGGGERFKQRVFSQVERWQDEGLPVRAGIFFAALYAEFAGEGYGNITPGSFQFRLGELN